METLSGNDGGTVQSLQKLCLKSIGRRLQHFCNLRLHPAVAQALSEPERKLIEVYDLSRLDVFEAQAYLKAIDAWYSKLVRRQKYVQPAVSRKTDKVLRHSLHYVLLPHDVQHIQKALRQLSIILGFVDANDDTEPATPSCKDDIVCYRLPVAGVGCAMIATMLQSSSTLIRLRLNNCQIADAGAILLASGLRLCTALQLFDVSNDDQGYREKDSMDNRINSTGVRAIALSLEKNQTIKQVNLSENPVGDGGVIAMAAMLSKNECLERLVLDGTQIQNTAEVLIDAFARSKSLKHLSMHWCALRVGVGAKLAAIQATKTEP